MSLSTNVNTKISFWLYYALTGLHALVGMFNVLLPLPLKSDDSSGLTILYPAYFCTLLLYFLSCGLMGVQASYLKSKNSPFFQFA